MGSRFFPPVAEKKGEGGRKFASSNSGGNERARVMREHVYVTASRYSASL